MISISGAARLAVAAALKYVGRAIDQLILPRRDLIGMNVELLSQLRDRPVVLQGTQGHLRLESRCGSGGLVSSSSLLILQAQHACRQAEIPLSHLFKNPGPLLCRGRGRGARLIKRQSAAEGRTVRRE